MFHFMLHYTMQGKLLIGVLLMLHCYLRWVRPDCQATFIENAKTFSLRFVKPPKGDYDGASNPVGPQSLNEEVISKGEVVHALSHSVFNQI